MHPYDLRTRNMEFRLLNLHPGRKGSVGSGFYPGDDSAKETSKYYIFGGRTQCIAYSK